MRLDEPASALDPELIGEVLHVMRDLAFEGRTMVAVTHEVGFASDGASHLVLLQQGLIEEQSAPRDVCANPKSERLRQFLVGARAA